MLCEKFTAANILLKQAGNDAEVKTAIELYHTKPTIIVGDDVDLLISRTPMDDIIHLGKLKYKQKFIHHKV